MEPLDMQPEPIDDCETLPFFCKPRQKPDYQFVGEGRGGYEESQVYQFVGEGHGAYLKHEVTEYRNWKLRPCTSVLCFALLAAFVAALMVNLGAFRGSSPPPPQHYLSRGATVIGAISGDGCAMRDCYCGDTAEWVTEHASFCCTSQGIGCPLDGSIRPPDTLGTLSSPIMGCQTRCMYKGESASCADRVKFVASNKHRGDPSRCVSAYTLVVEQCPFCSQCQLAMTGC